MQDHRVSFFEEEILRKTPLYYRYQVKCLKAEAPETLIGKRFSSSEVHQSKSYKQRGLYKPLAGFLLK